MMFLLAVIILFIGIAIGGVFEKQKLNNLYIFNYNLFNNRCTHDFTCPKF